MGSVESSAPLSEFWYLVYKDETGQAHTVKGSTSAIRRSLKDGLLGDADFFEGLEANTLKILARETGALAWAVRRCVEMKARIVGEDEREGGRRALLNLGHTFGHAVEAANGYGEALKHGEAVGLGCALAFRFSARLGLCAGQDAHRAERAIAAAGLPVRLRDVAGHPFRNRRQSDEIQGLARFLAADAFFLLEPG